MAMEVNATLLVQAFNFFIAYLLFRNLLFKPAFNALTREQQEQDHLKLSIKKREELLVQLAEQKKSAWQKHQEQFAQAAPVLRQTSVGDSSVEPLSESNVLTEDEIGQLASQVQQALVEGIKHE